MTTIQVGAHDASLFSGIGTKAIHAGQPSEPTTGAVIVPISLSTTFQQESPGVFKGYEYSRSRNPTRDALEANVAAVENAKYGLAFASGLAATTSIVSILKSGDEIISADDIYGGTRRLLTRILSPLTNINSVFVDFNKENALENAITEKTKLIWIETPTNPLLKIFDIKSIVEKVKGKDIIVAVDNTFSTPYFQQPIVLGADLVVHSATKYLNGHSDVVMGIICTNREDLLERLRYVQNGLGAVPSPFDSFLVMRGMKTLHIRLQRHAENAHIVAEFLQAHPKVDRVIYPGLKSHPQHELAKKQMSGFGGMITFYLKGGLTEAKTFFKHLTLITCAESLGGVESLIEHPEIMTHASVPEEARKELGISSSMVRLSVGIEDVEDLIKDLTIALDSFNIQ